MNATITQFPAPAGDSAPRRSVRDQDESLTGYLARIGQQAPPASAKETGRALAHYSSEYAALTRTLAVAEIYAAGFADGAAAAMTGTAPVVSLAAVAAAGSAAITEAAG
jgi:hypothetical protein